MRLALFGGTFDPIHNGHLRIAEEAREQLELDRVVFVPNRVSPFKTGRDVTPGALRAAMVRAAVADNPAFAVSTIELDRLGISYTVDTVAALRAEYPNAALFFLTGADAVRDLSAWREPERLLGLAQIAVATRPGVDENQITQALPARWLEQLRFIATPGLDISATDLRARIRDGRSIRYLVPPAVENFIGERRLYLAEKEDNS